MKTEWRSYTQRRAEHVSLAEGLFLLSENALSRREKEKMRQKGMWYVIQVRTGTEENICLQCTARIPQTVLERCFLPYYEEKKKIRGNWTVQKKHLFPGYVFVVTEDIEALHEMLKSVMGMTKLLGVGEDIVPLTGEEVQFLKRFGGEEQVVEMSEGIIENSETKILSGPLMGMEGTIRKIDRHKRKAWIEIEMFGRMQLVQVGLEILRKN